jgi:hypothetical protein
MIQVIAISRVVRTHIQANPIEESLVTVRFPIDNIAAGHYFPSNISQQEIIIIGTKEYFKQWKSILLQVIAKDTAAGLTPFRALLHNKSYFGVTQARRLYQDFKKWESSFYEFTFNQWRNSVDKLTTQDIAFDNTYRDLMQVFALGADWGIVHIAWR